MAEIFVWFWLWVYEIFSIRTRRICYIFKKPRLYHIFKISNQKSTKYKKVKKWRVKSSNMNPSLSHVSISFFLLFFLNYFCSNLTFQIQKSKTKTKVKKQKYCVRIGSSDKAFLRTFLLWFCPPTSPTSSPPMNEDKLHPELEPQMTQEQEEEAEYEEEPHVLLRKTSRHHAQSTFSSSTDSDEMFSGNSQGLQFVIRDQQLQQQNRGISFCKLIIALPISF